MAPTEADKEVSQYCLAKRVSMRRGVPIPTEADIRADVCATLDGITTSDDMIGALAMAYGADAVWAALQVVVSHCEAVLSLLRPEQRHALFQAYCPGCGGTRPCSCWNDE
jgi:hypothetical protein